uniref:MIH/VIH2 preproprotein n=1 Tax=Thysanoessa inermis TaxID=210626 RepID=A0A1W5LU73_9EUCA|nr:MIH/VIH2 preproprotein [Thysanoessa inermis]
MRNQATNELSNAQRVIFVYVVFLGLALVLPATQAAPWDTGSERTCERIAGQRHIAYKVEQICRDCENLSRDFQTGYNCRKDCYTSNTYTKCLMMVLKEKSQNLVNQYMSMISMLQESK